jgi:hypothetical protein
LIIICLLVWWQIGSKEATIVSVVTLGVASIPQIILTFKDPVSTPTGLYLIYTFAALLSFIGGSNWDIKDKLYPSGAFILSLLLTILSMRKGRIEALKKFMSFESPYNILW